MTDDSHFGNSDWLGEKLDVLSVEDHCYISKWMPCYPYGYLRQTTDPCNPGETRVGTGCRRDSFPLFQNTPDACLTGQCVDQCPDRQTLVSYFVANCDNQPELCGSYITALSKNGFIADASTIMDSINNFDVIKNIDRDALVLHPEIAQGWGERRCNSPDAPLWACGCYMPTDFYEPYSDLGFTRECSPPCMASNVPSVVKCDKPVCSVDMNEIQGDGSQFNIRESCPNCTGCSCIFFGNTIEAFSSKNINLDACSGSSDCFVSTGGGAIQVDCRTLQQKSTSTGSVSAFVDNVGSAITRFVFEAVTFTFAEQVLVVCFSIMLVFVLMFVVVKIIAWIL